MNRLRIVLEKAKFDEESFAIYKAYNSEIHDKEEKTTKSGYTSFLCEQALLYADEKAK